VRLPGKTVFETLSPNVSATKAVAGVALLLWLGLAICVAPPLFAVDEAFDREAVAAELGRRADGLGIRHIPLPNKLTPEMKAWLEKAVSRHAPPHEQLEQLTVALQSRRGLEIEYEAGFTGTAAEVFADERANCLSFTHLFVSLAREVGLQAYYVGVDRQERFRKSGDLIVMTGHVAAAWGYDTQRKLIEFNVVDETDPRFARKISDRRAHALYHANRGAELLQDSDLEAALRALTMAVILDVHLPDAWVNLGVARRRTGDLDGAEGAYQTALDLEADYLPAYHNLLMLFDLVGETDGIDELFEILGSRRNRNPYIYLELGDLSTERGRLDEAERFYRRAQRLDKRLAEPHAAMGLLALRVGEEDRARELLAKARDLDPEDARTKSLARRLAGASRGS